MIAGMRLSQKAIDEFKRIYLKEFGVLLDDEKAHELALNLLRVFDIVSRPLPSSYPQTSDNTDFNPLTNFNGTLPS